MGCNLSTLKPDDTAQAICLKPPFQQNFRDVDSSRILNRTQLQETGQLFAGISTADQPAVFQFAASPASPSSQPHGEPPQQIAPEHDLTLLQRVDESLITFFQWMNELNEGLELRLGPEGLNLLPDCVLAKEEEEKPLVSFEDRFAVILVALRLNRPVIVRDQPVIVLQPNAEGDESAQEHHELTNEVDLQLKQILDRRIQEAFVLGGFPTLDPPPPEDQHLTYPDLDPTLQQPGRLPGQIFESIEAPYFEQTHVTTFLIESTSSKLVEFCLSQWTGYQKPLIELTLIPAFHLDFNNRWTANCNLVDYTAIRFLDWWPDWWPLDRAISFTTAQVLKQLKICTKRSDRDGVQIRLMATQLSTLRSLPMLECLEIDKLHLSTIATALALPALQLLSIDSIELDGDQIVPDQKYLTIDAANLQEIYLGESLVLNRKQTSL